MPNIRAIEEFEATVDRVYGAFLDASAGIHQFKEFLDAAQREAASVVNLTLEQLDALPFVFGRGNPNEAGAVPLLRATQGDVKKRNLRDGPNSLFLGSMCLVGLYQFWEDKFRSAIAQELGLQQKELTHDVLGDLRLLRIAIVHHNGVAKAEIERCKVLKWFRSGDAVEITEDRMHELVAHIRGACREWLNQRSLMPGGA